jgi:hypothetical protein
VYVCRRLLRRNRHSRARPRSSLSVSQSVSILAEPSQRWTWSSRRVRQRSPGLTPAGRGMVLVIRARGSCTGYGCPVLATRSARVNLLIDLRQRCSPARGLSRAMSIAVHGRTVPCPRASRRPTSALPQPRFLSRASERRRPTDLRGWPRRRERDPARPPRAPNFGIDIPGPILRHHADGPPGSVAGPWRRLVQRPAAEPRFSPIAGR